LPEPKSKRITRDQYDAVLFDLDGVITNTASLHATCWKQMFYEYFHKRAEQGEEAFRPFEIATDYPMYVDGKPRFAGVRDFLSSRGIQLPEGKHDDPAELDTGVARRGNAEELKHHGAHLVVNDLGELVD
jgi:beta-phosphoglucomutase-like phosphatase (HAD superfamily)